MTKDLDKINNLSGFITKICNNWMYDVTDLNNDIQSYMKDNEIELTTEIKSNVLFIYNEIDHPLFKLTCY
jgi:hypothetical protein